MRFEEFGPESWKFWVEFFRDRISRLNQSGKLSDFQVFRAACCRRCVSDRRACACGFGVFNRPMRDALITFSRRIVVAHVRQYLHAAGIAHSANSAYIWCTRSQFWFHRRRRNPSLRASEFGSTESKGSRLFASLGFPAIMRAQFLRRKELLHVATSKQIPTA